MQAESAVGLVENDVKVSSTPSLAAGIEDEHAVQQAAQHAVQHAPQHSAPREGREFDRVVHSLNDLGIVGTIPEDAEAPDVHTLTPEQWRPNSVQSSQTQSTATAAASVVETEEADSPMTPDAVDKEAPGSSRKHRKSVSFAQQCGLLELKKISLSTGAKPRAKLSLAPSDGGRKLEGPSTSSFQKTLPEASSNLGGGGASLDAAWLKITGARNVEPDSDEDNDGEEEDGGPAAGGGLFRASSDVTWRMRRMRKLGASAGTPKADPSKRKSFFDVIDSMDTSTGEDL